MDNKLSRKDFLKRMGLLSVGVAGGAVLLNACGGGESSSSGSTETPSASSSSAKDCSAVNANLTEQDMATRNALAYVDQSEDPEKNCSNCRFFQPEKFAGACGGCQLFPNGGVNPNGNCKSWAAVVAG